MREGLHQILCGLFTIRFLEEKSDDVVKLFRNRTQRMNAGTALSPRSFSVACSCALFLNNVKIPTIPPVDTRRHRDESRFLHPVAWNDAKYGIIGFTGRKEHGLQKLRGCLSKPYDVVNARALVCDCPADMPVLWTPPYRPRSVGTTAALGLAAAWIESSALARAEISRWFYFLLMVSILTYVEINRWFCLVLVLTYEMKRWFCLL